MTFRNAVLLAAALGTYSVVHATPAFTTTAVDTEDGIYLTAGGDQTFTVDFGGDFDLAAITATDFIFEPTVTGETWMKSKAKSTNELHITVDPSNFPNNILHTIAVRAGATAISGTPTAAISAVNFIVDSTVPTIGTTDVTFSHDRMSNVDEVRSDTDSSKANVVTFTLTFSEPMHELEAADLTVEDASAGALTVAYVSGDKTHKHVYTATSPGGLADGLLVVTVVATANDLAGNTLAADVILAGTPTLDATVPTISGVSFLNGNNEINGDFVLTFTVASDDDLSVVDAPTATGYTFAAPVLVSGTTYTTAGAYQSGTDATLTITFPADSIKDSVKNGNQADTVNTFELDLTPPVVQIEHTVYTTCVTTYSHCKESTLTFVVASSGTDIAATPALSLTTAQQWVTGLTGGAVYVNSVTHTTGGVTVVYDIVDDPEFTISSGAGIFDVAGNVAATVNTNFLFDTTAPTLVSFTQTPAAGEKSNTKDVSIVATFSEPLSGIGVNDVLYDAGSDFSQTRNINAQIVTFAYTFTGTDLDGSASTTVTATASEGIDRANNAISNAVPNVVFDLDHVKPTATVSGIPTSNEVDGQPNWTLTVTFDEVVKNLDAEHFTLTNCEITDGVNTGGNVWEVVVTPIADGAVSIDIAGGSVEDEHGNTLDAVSGVSYTYDGTAPTIAAQLINNVGSKNVDFGSALSETELATFTVVVTVEDTNLADITAGNSDITVAGVASSCTIAGTGGSTGASQTFTYTVSACSYSGPGQVDVTVVGATYTIINPNNQVLAADKVFSFMYLGDVNTPPRIDSTIADASVNVGAALTPIDASAVFADAESVPADLKWSAVQVVNGVEAALPTWLVFTAKAGKTFTGTPAVADVAVLTIRVKVVDPSGASASIDFQLTVGYGTLQGCRDANATNYAPAAQFDGPCTYASKAIKKTEGGVITQRNLKVTIPPNALRGGGSNAEITTATVLESSLTGLPAGKPVIAPVIQLGPSQTFAEPVEVCMDVPDYKFDRNTRSLVMYTGDSPSGPWERTLTSSYDPVNKQLCGKTTHFSYFMGLDVGRQAGGGSCPNRCSGHGLCGPDSHCSCFRGYGGNDCSERLCKYGVAWVDENDMNPHLYAECSNNGECDRSSGLCQCFTGFEGPACDRTSCPNDCSGHGRCEFIQEFATSYDNTNWDHNKIRQCRCDGGYTGADCSGRICPVGDDPLTVPSSDEGEQWTYTIVRDLAVTGEYHLIIKDIFGNSFVTRAISYAATDADVKAALEATHGIVEIESVALDTSVSTELKVEVNLKNPPRIGDITAEVKDCADAGCFPKRAAVSGGTVTGSSSSKTRDADAKLETATCSNRGVCDTSTGRCTCFAGHSGLACERQSMLF